MRRCRCRKLFTIVTVTALATALVLALLIKPIQRMLNKV